VVEAARKGGRGVGATATATGEEDGRERVVARSACRRCGLRTHPRFPRRPPCLEIRDRLPKTNSTYLVRIYKTQL
jgi:hypothetical protein